VKLQPVRNGLDLWLLHLLRPAGVSGDAFLSPPGESALTAPDSVSWAVFKNPLALLIGGVAAVVLELAEPRVRSGVWTHSTFRLRPLDRLQRTGHAAMVTVYGARSRAEALIAAVGQRHAQVQGVTPDGQAYRATDPELLDWVHGTASFGFLSAYHAFVRPLALSQRDRFYAEGCEAARLYGATSAPQSEAEMGALLARMLPRLERSDSLVEFLTLMQRVPLLPGPLRWLQALLIRAAVQTIPADLRTHLGLDGPPWRLSAWQRRLVCLAGAAADRVILDTHPAVQACRRLGLPRDHLYAIRRIS
jgi:uncharacterized protein (DUF2236 family)